MPVRVSVDDVHEGRACWVVGRYRLSNFDSFMVCFLLQTDLKVVLFVVTVLLMDGVYSKAVARLLSYKLYMNEMYVTLPLPGCTRRTGSIFFAG